MPENVHKCLFSHVECRNCPIYRGRHRLRMPLKFPAHARPDKKRQRAAMEEGLTAI